VSRWIVAASLGLGWYLQDEQDRAHNLEVLAGPKKNDVIARSSGPTKSRMVPS
jgi:hypothetical protein